MSVVITLIENIFDTEGWEKHVVNDINAFLMERFQVFPATARIYHDQISEKSDVTPLNNEDIKRLCSLEGNFYVVVYPGDPVTIIVAAVAVVAAVAAFTMDVPNQALRNTQRTSPNNELSDRTNQERINDRVPDIYGTVRSTPDLLSPPYRVFENHLEVEHSYMCVGRGEYDIQPENVKDDTTRISNINGAAARVFKPFTSPNSLDTPQLTIGNPISEPIFAAKRNNAINGQVLRAPNSNSIRGSNDIKFNSLGQIKSSPESAINFTEKFVAGDTVQISDAVYTGPESGSTEGSYTKNVRFFSSFIEFQVDGAIAFSGSVVRIERALFVYNDGTENKLLDLSGTYTVSGADSSGMFLQNPSSVNSSWNLITGNFTDDKTPYKSVDITVSASPESVNLNGSYSVVSVSPDTITLDSPASIKSDWNNLTSFPNNETGYISPKIVTTGNKFIGWFTLDEPGLTDIYFNFVALNGLYKDDGKKQLSFDVQISVIVRAVDENDNPLGIAESHSVTLTGSATTTSTRAVTLKVKPSFSGRCQVRAWRATPSDLDFEGSVVDEVKWRDVYAMSRIELTDFGDMTTVQSLTYATDGALALKKRKLNLIATRKITTIDNGLPSTSLSASNRADDIILSVCLDKRIGNLTVSDVDISNIQSTVNEVATYFGTDKVIEFNYTFDNDNVSFEETVGMIANAIFCRAYRRGNIIKLSFERRTLDSLILFNHRNKLPGSETRTVRFGNQHSNDGVELEYVDPSDGSLNTIKLPFGIESINPKKIETVGIRSYEQAFFHAMRAWNKIQYQNVAVEFEATQEADLLVINDRILVADNTRTGTQDGEIRGQDGLIIELSQPCNLNPTTSYSIFIQHTDASVECIPISEGADEYHVILGKAPKQALSLDLNNYAIATYQIVSNESPRELAFLLTEKDNQDNFTSRLTAINYDDRYYLGDALHLSLDFQTGYRQVGSSKAAVIPQSTAQIVTNSEGKTVHKGFTGSDSLVCSSLIATDSYTKIIIIKKPDDGNICYFLSGPNETLFVSTGGNVRAGHSTPVVISPVIDFDEWVFIAVAYDANDDVMELTINDALVDTALNVGSRYLPELNVIGDTAGFNALIGECDYVAHYRKYLTPSEIQQMKTQIMG